MAQLTVTNSFCAQHGSFSKHTTLYTVQVTVKGNVILGLTNHCDSNLLESKLESICNHFQGKYLDELIGRATHEMIALWIFQNVGVCVESITVSGDLLTVVVDRSDFLHRNFDSVFWQQKGMTAFLRGSFFKAENLFTAAIASDDQNEEAYLLRGRVYRYTEEFEKAATDFKVVINLKPEWSEGYRNMGNMLLFSKQYDQMLPYFIRATELAPRSSIAFNNLGYAYFCLGKWEQARCYSQHAVTLNPTYYEAHLDLAEACYKLQLFKEAKQHREIAAQLKKQSPTQQPPQYQIADGEDYL